MTAAGQWPAGAGDATTVMPTVVVPGGRWRRREYAREAGGPKHRGGSTAVALWLRRYWRPRLIMVMLLAWIAFAVTVTCSLLVGDSRTARLDQRALACQALVNQASVARQPLPHPSVCDDVRIQVRLGQQPTPAPAARPRR